MRRLWLVLVIVLVAALGTTIWVAVKPAPQATAAGTKWIEKRSGAIPKAWGDLVGVSSAQGIQTTLVFKDAKGTLRRIQWNASGGLSKVVHILDRKY